MGLRRREERSICITFVRKFYNLDFVVTSSVFTEKDKYSGYNIKTPESVSTFSHKIFKKIFDISGHRNVVSQLFTSVKPTHWKVIKYTLTIRYDKSINGKSELYGPYCNL